ncbi:SIR2 family protein [Staphylococcus hominis]
MEFLILKKFLDNANSLPYLFIGSGFSKRYLDLPNWEELLNTIADLVYSDEFQYAAIKSKAKKIYDPSKDFNGYMAYLCDLISNDLDKIWYTDDKFKENREKYRDFVLNKGVLPIKIEIAELIIKNSDLKPSMSKEIEALKLLSTHSIAGIITTNYDTLIENLFNFITFKSQQELLFHKNHEISEIYKIHGCVTDPSTIMINSDDYKVMNEKNKYLASKLLTIFIEHPIIFIGYSINDEDIKNILYDIVNCLNTDQKEILENRLIFINWDSKIDGIIEENRIIGFKDNSSISIKSFRVSDFTLIYNELAKVKSKYPVKLLRNIKKDMYNLALSEEPSDKVMVNLPHNELLKDEYNKIEYVFGFGVIELAKKGYTSPTSQEIYYDVVLDTENYDSDSLLLHSIPELQKMYGDMPRFKYINSAKETTIDFVKNNYKPINNFEYFLNNTLINRHIKEQTISEVLQNYDDPKSQIYNILSLEESQFDLTVLYDYLFNLMSNDSTLLNDEQDKSFKTNLRKLIKIYDWMKFK